MKKTFRRFLSLFLCAFLLITMIPFYAGAAGNTAYVSASGTISGVSGTVYTDVQTAVSSLGTAEATVYVSGSVTLPKALSVPSAVKTLTFAGVNDAASGNVVNFLNTADSFLPQGGASIVFRNITLRHGDGTTTEDWIGPNGGSLTFEDSCLYQAGKNTNNGNSLALYIGTYLGTKGGEITFNASAASFSMVATIAGWTPSTNAFTTNGDFRYTFNAGTFADIFGGMRNGTSGAATLNGDVYYTFNGGVYKASGALRTGHLGKGILHGNVIFTFNGGEFADCRPTFGSGSPEGVTAGAAMIFNADKIHAAGKPFRVTVSEAQLYDGRGKHIVVINHKDIAASDSNISIDRGGATIDQFVTTVGGSALPRFAPSKDGTAGAFLGYEMTADEAGKVPTVDKRVLTPNADGLYTFDDSADEIAVVFLSEDEVSVNVTYRCAGQTPIVRKETTGGDFVFPGSFFHIPEGKVFAGWRDEEGFLWREGESCLLPENPVYDAEFIDIADASYFYVSSSGSDDADGVSLSSAFLTVDRAVQAINASGAVSGTVCLVDKASAVYTTAHEKMILFTGGVLGEAAETFTLGGDVLLRNVTVGAGKVYTNGHELIADGVSLDTVILASANAETSDNGFVLTDGGSISQLLLTDGKNTTGTDVTVLGGAIASFSAGTAGTVSDARLSFYGGTVGAPEVSGARLTGRSAVHFFGGDADDGFLEDADKTGLIVLYGEEVYPLDTFGVYDTEGKYPYAFERGGNRLFCTVGETLTIAPGIYDVSLADAEGIDYIPYPASVSADGTYFAGWEKTGDGAYTALYSSEKTLMPYYVSETGDDENVGTSVKAPFKTLTAAVNAIGKENDGLIRVLDTVYWNEDAKICYMPDHTGTITIEGADPAAYEKEIVDFSAKTASASVTGLLELRGPTVFRNITFRGHQRRFITTNGHDLTLEGKIGYIRGTSGAATLDIYLSALKELSAGACVTLACEGSIGTVNVGYNKAASLTSPARLVIDGADIGTVALCGKGSRIEGFDLVYVSGTVGSYVTNSSTTAAFNGDYLFITSDGKTLALDNAGNILPTGSTTTVSAAAGIKVIPADEGKDRDGFVSLRVLSGGTVRAEDGKGNVTFSSKNGYLTLPVGGTYTLTASADDYYENDGETITVKKAIALTYGDTLYHRPAKDGEIFAGWRYDGKTTGPADGTMLEAGTVLKAAFPVFDPDEFTVIGCQIRTTEPQGLRFITEKKTAFDEKFGVKNFGTAVLPAEYLVGELFPDTDYRNEATGITAHSADVSAKNIFSRNADGLTFTACLIGIAPANYDRRYAVRPYAHCEDANGNPYILYGETLAESLVDFARNNMGVCTPEDLKTFENVLDTWKSGYFGEGVTSLSISPYKKAYKVNKTGVRVRELEIDSGRGDPATFEIAVITDAHISSSKPTNITAFRKALDCAAYSELLVLNGDNVEAGSDTNNLKMMKEYVFDRFPDAMCVIGNHEQFYGDAKVARANVDGAWPHDTSYYSRVFKDKVMVVTMDDNVSIFTEEQCDKLESDLAAARENGWAVLIFQHIHLNSLAPGDGANRRMASIVSSYGDVIKAMFFGHNHVDSYSEIKAQCPQKDGTTKSVMIPCYNLRACNEGEEQGNMLKILVK